MASAAPFPVPLLQLESVPVAERGPAAGDGDDALVRPGVVRDDEQELARPALRDLPTRIRERRTVEPPVGESIVAFEGKRTGEDDFHLALHVRENAVLRESASGPDYKKVSLPHGNKGGASSGTDGAPFLSRSDTPEAYASTWACSSRMTILNLTRTPCPRSMVASYSPTSRRESSTESWLREIFTPRFASIAARMSVTLTAP